MNKISFRDLIDLEPKPKKVKYDGDEYELLNEWYRCKEHNNVPWFEYNAPRIETMKEPNIEIIEEDVVIELLDMKILDYTTMFENAYGKINELIDYINKKEGK